MFHKIYYGDKSLCDHTWFSKAHASHLVLACMQPLCILFWQIYRSTVMVKAFLPLSPTAKHSNRYSFMNIWSQHILLISDHGLQGSKELASISGHAFLRQIATRIISVLISKHNILFVHAIYCLLFLSWFLNTSLGHWNPCIVLDFYQSLLTIKNKKNLACLSTRGSSNRAQSHCIQCLKEATITSLHHLQLNLQLVGTNLPDTTQLPINSDLVSDSQHLLPVVVQINMQK